MLKTDILFAPNCKEGKTNEEKKLQAKSVICENFQFFIL